MATDIWSFRAIASLSTQKDSSICLDLTYIQLINLLYRAGFHIFKSDASVDHEDYDLKILIKHHQWFGPFPASYNDVADQNHVQF